MKNLLEMVSKKPKRKLADVERKLAEAERALVDADAALAGALKKIAVLEVRNKSLVAEKHFWSEQGMHLTNQVEIWQRMYRELMQQTLIERQDVDIRSYAKAIAQAIEEAKPRAAEVAACIAMASSSTQGVKTVGWADNKQPKRVEFIDVGDNGDAE